MFLKKRLNFQETMFVNDLQLDQNVVNIES